MDSRTILKKALSVRSLQIESGDFSFTAKRPTKISLMRCRNNGVTSNELYTFAVVLDCVNGWQGVKVSDIVDGSDDDSDVPFSNELLGLLLEDRVEISTEIATALFDAYTKHNKAEDAEKK